MKQLQNKSDTAQELASVIKNSNLSYRKLEKMTGLSKTTIKRYADCEIKKVSIDAIRKICEATHTDLKTLSINCGNGKKLNIYSLMLSNLSSKNAIQLVKSLEQLNDKQAEQVISYISFLQFQELNKSQE